MSELQNMVERIAASNYQSGWFRHSAAVYNAVRRLNSVDGAVDMFDLLDALNAIKFEGVVEE